MHRNDPLHRLHRAADGGTPDEVTALAREVADVDAVVDGRTALWIAVDERRPDNALALVAAGADPWRPMMSGWSPGRLALAGPTPDLFGEARESLSAGELVAVAESGPLLAAFAGLDDDGWSICCVGDLDTGEALRRLGATELPGMPAYDPGDWDDLDLHVLGFTDVPGGLVVSQPWAFGGAFPVVSRLLSAGTVAYAMYANPKSGDQGSVHRDAAFVGGDLSPGGWVEADAPSEEVLRAFLYKYDAPAYCCAYAGVRPAGADVIVEPRRWARLPERDYWAVA